MKNALNFVRNIEAVRELEPAQDPSFAETVGASLAYKYGPIMDLFEESYRFPKEVEPGFVASQNIPEDLIEYAPYMARATNQEHMDFLATELRNGLKTRETLAQSGIMAQFGAEIFDPVNWITVPFTAGSSLPVSFARAGAATASVVAGQELLRAPFDPVGTTSETAINIGSAFIIGGALGGLTSIPATRRIKVQQAAEKEIENLRTAIEPSGDAEFDASIAPSLFTDSWLYKGVTTPMKRILTDESIPNSVKLNTLAIANDAGVLLSGNKSGQALKPSVYQSSKLYEGEWVSVYDELQKIWGESTGEGVVAPLDYMWKRGDFETWLTEVDRKAIQKVEPANDFEARAMESLNKFYGQWEQRLREEGLIGSAQYYEKAITKREAEIERLQATIKSIQDGKPATLGKAYYDEISKLESEIASLSGKTDTASQQLATNLGVELSKKKSLAGQVARHNSPRERAAHIELLQQQIARHQDEIDMNRAAADEAKQAGEIMPPNEDVYRPRYYDRKLIDDNRDKLKAILEEWYRENPRTTIYNEKTRKYERVTLNTDPESVSYRADQTIKAIMNEADQLDPDLSFSGVGKAKHFKHRTLDIPNSLVLDFIERNPVRIMKAYVHRTGPRYEFSRAFGGRSIDDVIDDNISEMLSKGVPIEKAYKATANMRLLYDRVVGTSIRNPDSWDKTIAKGLRDAAQLNYLGPAGISTLTEPAKIIMEHGLGPTFRGLFTIMKNNQLRLGAKEGRIAGEGLDILSGSAHMRLVEELSNNPLQHTFIDKVKDAFYLLNGLAPITRILKDFDAMMRVHTLIDYSVRLTQGKALKKEAEYLARYGIDADMAKRIANAPWQKSEGGLYLGNTEAWSKLDLDQIKSEIAPTHKPSQKSILDMSEEELLDRFRDEFYVDRIITDQEIVDDVFAREGAPKILGRAVGTELEEPATIYINVNNVKRSFAKFKSREDLAQFTKDLDKALEDGIISEAAHAHQMTYVKNADLFDNEDDFLRFVMMHELHHTTHFQRVGESNAAYESRIDDLAVSYMRNEREQSLQLAAEKEYDKRVREMDETVNTFRTALSSGILNTILMGTPADKPNIVDGIVLIPMRVAKQFGMKEDPKYKGYARIENGLLGLPFQFYSYTLAAVNKTTAAMAHGQLKNQYYGTAIAMGLGYMVLQYKTPDFVEMSFQDQFARSFDYSGVAALYSDLLYTGMATSLALGGPNLTGGFLQPRFPQKPDAIDAATGLLGAGPSIGADISRGVYDIVTGNPGEGTKEVIRNLPFMRLWFLKGLVNNMTRAIETELDGPSGFGRY